MSTDYCAMKTISFAELFDGRMARYGVSEQIRPRETSDVTRTLTDGGNVLWVYADDNGTVAGMTRYGMSNAPGRILAAVAEAFDTEIFSERAYKCIDGEEWVREHNNKFISGGGRGRGPMGGQGSL